MKIRYIYLLMRTEYSKETGKLGPKICDGAYTSKVWAISNMKVAAESLAGFHVQPEVDITDRSVVYRGKYSIVRFRIIKQPINVLPWDNCAEPLRITEKELAG